MPFGAKNALATYARFIDLLIGKLRLPYLLAYVDDVIIRFPYTGGSDIPEGPRYRCFAGAGIDTT